MVDVQAVRVVCGGDDGWTGKIVVAVVVYVVEGDGEGSEGLEICFWVSKTEQCCCAEGVDED